MCTTPKTFHSTTPLLLESGETLRQWGLAYHTQGQLNEAGNNVIWVCHALTANSDPFSWWDGIVGTGCLFDPSEHFIICANMLGSCYGSTNALSINPDTGEPYYHAFPTLTIRDMVKAFDRLRIYLGIERIDTLIGGSMGGQQALEWAITQPQLFKHFIPIATNAQHSPWGIAFNASQRLAIEADSTWKENREDAGKAGLAAARATAMLSYRNYDTYNTTQADENHKIDHFKASSYQTYQGSKLADRFNAFSYFTLSKAMDSHNVGRDRGGIEHALSQIQARTLVMGISSDILFPIEEQQRIAEGIEGADFQSIDSLYGHDGFLIEFKAMEKALRRFFGKHRLKLAKIA